MRVRLDESTLSRRRCRSAYAPIWGTRADGAIPPERRLNRLIFTTPARRGRNRRDAARRGSAKRRPSVAGSVGGRADR